MDVYAYMLFAAIFLPTESNSRESFKKEKNARGCSTSSLLGIFSLWNPNAWINSTENQTKRPKLNTKTPFRIGSHNFVSINMEQFHNNYEQTKSLIRMWFFWLNVCLYCERVETVVLCVVYPQFHLLSGAVPLKMALVIMYLLSCYTWCIRFQTINSIHPTQTT